MDVMVDAGKQKGEKTDRKFEVFQVLAEVVILCWILGLFFYYYKQQGFFSLIQQLFKGVA